LAPELRRFHGRRLARPLTQRRKELIEHLLPDLRIVLPETGTLDARTLFVPPRKQVWLEIGFGGGEHLLCFVERLQPTSTPLSPAPRPPRPMAGASRPA